MVEINGYSTKRKGLAALIALLIHLAVVALLFVFVLPAHPHEEQGGGILVNIGELDMAEGTFDPMPVEPEFDTTEEPSSPPVEDAPLLTQETPDAPTVDAPKPVKQTNKEQVERERKLREQRQAEEQRKKTETEERKRQEAIRNKVSGAFGNAQNSKGSGKTPGSKDGKEGSPFGNVHSGGVNTGVGGWGSYSLSGRSIGSGGLPRPAFTTQVEGTIVIEITVDPTGKVISTNIAPGTTISDYSMRQSALQSAAKARFNAIDGHNNQVGTITYKYRLN